jgi:hypothetical protein
MGGVFWIFLWLFVMAPHERIPVPDDSTLVETAPPAIELSGFRIRQETPYTDNRFTWMDLEADRGWSLENDNGSHKLVNVRVRLVTKRGPDTSAISLHKLSKKAEVAWVLIQSATGISFKNRDIRMMGNVQVYGFTRDGDLAEWIQTEDLLYDYDEGRVRSLQPATYEGRSFPAGQPVRCFMEAESDLSEINISDYQPLPSTLATPIRFPAMRPVCQPPDALRFLDLPEKPTAKEASLQVEEKTSAPEPAPKPAPPGRAKGQKPPAKGKKAG